MNRTLLFALALSAGVLGGTPLAAAPDGPQAVKVRYGDLDLSTADGARMLDRRVERALRRVCDFNGQERQLKLKAAAVRCMADTRTKIAMPDIPAARVAAR